MKLSAPLITAFTATLLSASPAFALPTFNEVKAAYTPSEAWLLARDGRPLQSLRVNHEVRRLPWTPLNEISPALTRAVILAEDRNFYEHDGVDWKAAGNAAWKNFWNSRTRGASTLTMQLTGMLDADNQQRGRRSLFEKATQTATALRIEASWSKRQIFEAYLNLASFRGELQGVTAMSRGVFGKWPDGLDEREAALAAALLRAPNATSAAVAQRACALLKSQQRDSECAGLDGMAASVLRREYRPEADTLARAPHLARKLITQPGQRIRSTLDADLQRIASEALRRHIATLARQNAQDGAVLVLDNASGEVLAWVGSSGDLSEAEDVDGVSALRQAGSTLKPFLYAQAFEQRHLTPASLIEDAPLSLDTGNGLYVPQNYEPHYRGWVSARMALAGSLNVPAVKTLIRVTPDAFQQRLRLTGFNSLTESGDWYGYSLALGSADVSLLMLANGYRTLANNGRWSPLRVTAGSATNRSAKASAVIRCAQPGCAGVFDGTPREAFTPQAAFMVSDVLADRRARAGTFGLDSWLATNYWAAGKTGTSKDMRDNWCVGYSRRYTVAVWVGNATGDPMHDVSGVSGAAPVWRDVMDWLHQGDASSGRPKRSSTPPPAPRGVVQTRIRFETGTKVNAEPPRQEWFLAGTERNVIRSAAARALARIDYPADGTLIALDPDIPPQRQRILLRTSSPPGPGTRWQLDSQSLGDGTTSVNATRWLPRPGRHRLTLVDAQGNELDAVVFEVRAMKQRKGK